MLLGERRLSPALPVACVLIGAWLLLAPRSPDLAAQTYRATLFEHEGFSLWDNNWYAGHHLPGYSLVFPWLALLVGIGGNVFRGGKNDSPFGAWTVLTGADIAIDDKPVVEGGRIV